MLITHTHKIPKSRKSQSAMEYLMTYGWAILIIAVVLGVLFQLGVFSGSSLTPKAQPGSCQVQRLLGQVSLEGQCTGLLPQSVAYFNGASSYVNIGNPSSLGFQSSSFSIVAWAKPINSGGGGYIISKPRSGFAGSYGMWLQPSGSVFLLDSDITDTASNQVVEFSNPGISGSGGWYQLAVTFNRGGIGTSYVNGALNTSTLSITNIGSLGNAYNLAIGADSTLACCYFNGYISNVQLYNTSLSSNEIKALYLEGIGGAPVRVQNLAGWWPLNGDVKDYSGNNNNGQVYNGVAFNSTWQNTYTPP